jgi:hypothetical protein
MESDKRRFKLLIAAAALYVLFVAYPLSVGPGVWLCEKFEPDSYGPMRRFADLLYGPLGFTVDHTGTEDLFAEYVGLFVEIRVTLGNGPRWGGSAN